MKKKVKSKKEVILEAQRDKQKVHFATLMDMCHLKSGVGTKITEVQRQSRARRMVDDLCIRMFTEQGSSAQMSAAKIMDVITRLPGCDGQAADAVSAYTLVKLQEAPRLLKIPKTECPDVWIPLPRHNWPKSAESIADPVVPLERNLYGHPLAGLSWERQFEEAVLELAW